MNWERTATGYHCGACGDDFPNGRTCSCAPDESVILEASEPPIDPDFDDELAVRSGVLQRLADIARKSRAVGEMLELKALEFEHKVLRTLLEEGRRSASTQTLDSIDRRLAKLDAALSNAKGSAGRADRVTLPVVEGRN